MEQKVCASYSDAGSESSKSLFSGGSNRAAVLGVSEVARDGIGLLDYRGVGDYFICAGEAFDEFDEFGDIDFLYLLKSVTYGQLLWT